MFNRNLKVVFFILTLSLTLSGCVHFSDGPYRGKILELETEKPIEDAAVLGVWHVDQYGGIGGPVAKFFDAKEAVTNKNGEFEVPSVSGFYWWPFSKLAKPRFTIYKPGYDSYPPYNLEKPGITVMEQQGFLEHEGSVIRLQRVKTKDERIKVLYEAEGALYVDIEDLDLISKMAPYLLKITTQETKELGLPLRR